MARATIELIGVLVLAELVSGHVCTHLSPLESLEVFEVYCVREGLQETLIRCGQAQSCPVHPTVLATFLDC